MKKILVVDDLPDNVELLAQTLEDYDYDVISAENGRGAIDKATSELPDLILLDVMMPDLDGYSVCDILTSKEETLDIPIIMLTAKTLPEDLKKGFDVGAHDYIKKPFEEVELIARVQAALRLKDSRDALKTKNIELLNMAEELSIKNKDLAGLIRDSPVATLSTDLGGRVQTSNPSSIRLLGYPQEEVIGSSISKFLEKGVDYSSLGDMNMHITKVDGTKIPVTVSTAVSRGGGEDKGFIITLKDLSELKGLIIQPVEEEEEFIDGDLKCFLNDGICYMIDSD
ncbi:MAG: response regulator, partial [Halobacteriota archaeon]|nr:response regulator [Halobacteriota archaeon]